MIEQRMLPPVPIQTLHLFPLLDELLHELLCSLTMEEWHAQTIAKKWKVKDVAAHLLDGNIRTLSFSRDGYMGEEQPQINSYKDLVDYLNNLNAVWVNAAKRFSPQLLIELLESTGKDFIAELNKLDLHAPAIFSVAWAGKTTSLNWFHVAREYTEKFIHQQQIREAVNKQALFTKELFYPFIDTFMYGLPVAYKNMDAANGTVVSIEVTTEAGGKWFLQKNDNGWQLLKEVNSIPQASLIIDPPTAWKLFSKGITPQQAMSLVELHGDKELAAVALNMVSVMA